MIKLQFAVKSHEKVDRYRKRVRTLKPIRPSRIAEASYRDKLLHIVSKLNNVAKEELLPFLLNQPDIVQDGVMDSSTGDEIRRRIKELARRVNISESDSTIIASNIIKKIKTNVDERLASEIRKSVSIDISPALRNDTRLDSLVQQAVKENVALIKTIPQQYFEKLEKYVIEAFEKGDRHEKLALSIKKVAQITESRAKIIARDQTSKINGSFNRIRQTSIGIDTYTWSTSQDERVRDSHVANEGKKFKWDDPPEETGHPGEDIMCRCVAIPFFDLDQMEKDLGI